MTKPSRPASNGRAAVRGVVVVAGRQRPDDVERAERQRRQRDLAAARDGRIDPALAQVAERLAQRDRPRRAGVGRRQDRAADVQSDAEIGRRGAAEHGQGEVRGDLADALLEVALVLRLGVGDATERRAEVDPDPLGGGRPVARPGANRASSRASRPAAMPIWLNRSSRRAWSAGMKASGSKSSTWAATCERNGEGSKRSIALDRRPRGPQPGAERVHADAGRGHDADAGDPDASSVGHVERFVETVPLDSDGLGERRERRQRATGDRAA